MYLAAGATALESAVAGGEEDSSEEEDDAELTRLLEGPPRKLGV